MSEKIVQLNEEVIKGQIKELVRGSVEETLNELLEKEAESLTQAARYERSEARQGYRSGHYDRNLTTTSGDVTLHMPRLKGVSFETAIIERYRRRESSVEEALIEMYLAGVSVRRVEDVEQIEHFTGSGLYDREFIEILRKLDDPTPFLRGIVAELGYKRKEIPYEQPKRRAGKTHNNFYRLYDAAMLSVTSYTKEGLRLATIFGGVCAAGSMIIALIYLVMKLIWWDRFPAGMAPMLIGMLFLGSVQLFFIGFLGEYIMSINQRVMKRPLVIEEERLNFDQKDENAKDGKANEV